MYLCTINNEIKKQVMVATYSTLEDVKKIIYSHYEDFTSIGRTATVVVNSDELTISIHPEYLKFSKEDFSEAISYAKGLGCRVYDNYTDEIL